MSNADSQPFVSPDAHAGPRRLRHTEHLALSAFWGASNFIWGALLLILIASQVRDMIGVARSAQMVGLIISLGAIPAIVVPLIFGPLSDRFRSRIGRRRPFILVGGLINIVGLVVLYWAGLSSNVWLYLAMYFVLQFGNNIATAAYSGVIPDLVPVEQRGLASGYMGVMSQAGTLAGIVVTSYLLGSFGYLAAYAALIAVLIFGIVVSMVGIKEPPATEPVPPFSWRNYLKSLWINPFEYPDFAWVWITRALVMLGFYAVMPFILYFLTDVIRVTNPEGAVRVVSGIVLVAATFSSIIGGALSDRLGRKRIVYFANTFMAITCVGFALVNSLPMTILVAGLFGLAYGAYISVDWALGTDVLPDKENAAKDMAVWHISLTLPQAIASFPAGLLVAAYGVTYYLDKEGLQQPRYTEAGFDILFIGAALCVLLGAVLLRRVKGST